MKTGTSFLMFYFKSQDKNIMSTKLLLISCVHVVYNCPAGKIKLRFQKFMKDASIWLYKDINFLHLLGIQSKDIKPTWYLHSIHVGVLYKWKCSQHIGYLICGNIFTFPSIKVRMKYCQIVINICWIKCLKVYFLTIKFNVTHLKVSPNRSLK